MHPTPHHKNTYPTSPNSQQQVRIHEVKMNTCDIPMTIRLLYVRVLKQQQARVVLGSYAYLEIVQIILLQTPFFKYSLQRLLL